MKVYIKVKPNSSKQEIVSFGDVRNANFGAPRKPQVKQEGFLGFRYLVYLKSQPEDNKANIELIKLMSKYLGTPSTRIKIISGLSSHNKILEVD